MSYTQKTIQTGSLYYHHVKHLLDAGSEIAYACNVNIPLSEPLDEKINSQIGTRAKTLYNPLIMGVLLVGQTNPVENGLYVVNKETKLLSRHPKMPYGADAYYIGVKCHDNWLYCCRTVNSKVGQTSLSWTMFSTHLTAHSEGRLEELSDIVQSMILPQLKELTRMVTDIYYAPNGPIAQSSEKKFQASSAQQQQQSKKRQHPESLDDDE